MKLRQLFFEGGNLAAGQDKGWKGDPGAGAAQQINLKVTDRSFIVPVLNKLLADINAAYQSQYQQPLWDPKLLKSQQFLSGSSLHFFNLKNIPDKVFIEKKPQVGDIDTMVDKDKEDNLNNFLQANLNKRIGASKFLGYQRGNEQFSSLWELDNPPIKIQIDLEFVAYEKDKPTDWSRFSHSSSWEDLQSGVKGVFHKFLISSLGILSKREFILRKQEGRGKNRTWVDKPVEDSMLSFAVSSKEGGGLRAKYTPVLNPVTNQAEVKDGLPVMMALPAAGYEQDIGKMFQTLFGVKMDEKSAEKLADKFWSFTGLLEVMNKLLDPQEKSRVLGSFLNKTFGQGAQGLYKNDPERDSAEKMAAIDLLMKTTGAKPPEGINVEQMRQDYTKSYKVTEQIVDEDDVTAPAKPDYARQGIQHIYNRLPDGRVSSMEMKDADFIALCKEIADNGGTLNGIQVNLKVDGAGIRFGKDESGRPFFMTSRVTQPLYRDNVGFFTDFGTRQGQSQEQLARTKHYDDALELITSSKFIQKLPPDSIVQAEMMYNPMAQEVDGLLKFVNIPYDPKKLGRQMTLVPFMVKTYSSGQSHPQQDKIIQALQSSSDSNIKIITNKLEQQGINVSKVIAPVLNLDPNLEAALKAKGNNPEKEKAKAILDKARQDLSAAIIDSPKLKGKDALGTNMEGIVVNMPSGRLVKVTSQKMKDAMAAKMAGGQTFGDTKPRTAVVAIGNFAGHRGHEQLINFAIDKAKKENGTPFVFVGHKVGPDDPIDIKTKLETLNRLFPGVSISVVENQVDASGQETQGSLFKKIEYELIKKEPFYNNIFVAVGSDQAALQKTIDQMQGRYKKFAPLAHVKVNLYVTPRGSQEGGTGLSTTQLRNALKTMPEDQAFAAWSKAYNVEKLGPDWIRHLMNVARKNMGLEKQQQQQQQQQQQPQQQQPQQQQPSTTVAERLITALGNKTMVKENTLQELDKPSGKMFLIFRNRPIPDSDKFYTVAFGGFGHVYTDVKQPKIRFNVETFEQLVQQVKKIFKDTDFIGAKKIVVVDGTNARLGAVGQQAVQQFTKMADSGEYKNLELYTKDPNDDGDEKVPRGLEKKDPKTGAWTKVHKGAPQGQMGGSRTGYEVNKVIRFQIADPRVADMMRKSGIKFANGSFEVDQEKYKKIIAVLNQKFGNAGDLIRNKQIAEYKNEDMIDSY